MNEVIVETNGVLLEDEGLPEFSWRAVFAGALVGSAVIFFLLFLGAGLGLSMVTVPQANAATVQNGLTLGGIYFFAALAFGMAVGGYLAGRLMGPVLESEAEELFHATAHGLVVWAVAVVATATMTAIGGFVLSGAGLTAGAILGTPSMASQQSEYLTPSVTGYWVDTLFRPAAAAPAVAATPADGAAPPVNSAPASSQTVAPEARAEASRILTTGLAGGGALSQPDSDRLAMLVAQYSGADAMEAARRVGDVQMRIRQQETQAAEIARKVLRNISLLLAASLIFGALVASASAVLGRTVDDQARLEA